MRKVAIHLEGIGKQYRIGATSGEYEGLTDSLTHALMSPFRRAGRLFFRQAPGDGKEDATFWALQHVSFEVAHGEVTGIIGRNGAGKSTLLKILSRITKPTAGFAEIHGRVASLLEVGTGFHYELTGRENIYLNGAILGMKKAEIAQKFDQIVAFAEVERFIDTPVKHYSSGMYLRLAFAVAAHLEPEILLVDEVLAVGDARFQKKCINKMQEVGQEGRTVLFVSHSMPAITRLCERVILLDEGKVLQDGPAYKVVGAYLNSGLGTTPARDWLNLDGAPGDEIVRLCGVRVRTEEGLVTDAVDIRRPIAIEMEYEVLKSGHILVPSFRFIDEQDICIFTVHDRDPAWQRRPRPAGRFVSTVWIPGNFLTEATLTVGAKIVSDGPFRVHFNQYPVVAFQVIDSLEGDSVRGDYAGKIPGVVRPLLKWSTYEYSTTQN